MSLLNAIMQESPENEQPTLKVVATNETDPHKPRFLFSSTGSKRARPYDSRLFVHAVDRLKNFIYFGVDYKLGGEDAKPLSHADMIGILDNPVSEEFFIECCTENLPLQEAGINNKRRVFASPSGELELSPKSPDSYPVVEVRFISYT